ncbi:ureidoglycolate lyase [Sulfitobacter geojensis]|uniref:Ureidoglycolate lyase n=1 Tax=Sulfitobacter geojensis TaxID=1342299 RepID=A0AAE2VYF8_9RHOB|nr:ureidoglycolate lyase [Sulfitobacter geojensis]MBM1689798.1 ureidoglycolate lyase [Sulfitobacter geojensis]MBM1693864.1 ureidoglycolate lyase [Sulfitobacter geojensis]MBM1706030.1 ureidoglycolate lyase [Sulfitobacter geojensis]MBM1710088.1 ureidoglycolate lyase [Sulfitobacter geojensis]MBM1714154.1 ureidoglycolate lyase [Sulfitobacter geojensis]
MSREVKIEPLSAAAFAPFGDVLDASGTPDKIINAGLCGRHHDRAHLDFGPEGRAGISLFNAEARSLPYELTLLERHPDGSQAFLPMTGNPFLVIVAADENGTPGTPRAFLTAPHQGINFHRGIWHGVLTPLSAPGLFAVVDRIGNTANLEEVSLAPPYRVTS